MPNTLSLRSSWTRAHIWVSAHKITSAILAVALIGGGYWYYGKTHSTAGQTRYVLGEATIGTIIASISGSGQVSTSDQVAINPKASGEITSVLVKEGQAVSAGQALAYIDATNAQKSVRDAQANLESAKISLSKLMEPADKLSMTQDQNAIVNASTTLVTTYRNSVNDITSAFLDMPDIMTGLQDVVTGTETNRSAQWNIDFYKNSIQNYTPKGVTYRDDAYNSYVATKAEYDQSISDFKAATLTSNDTATVERILAEAYKTTQDISATAKNIGGFVQFYEDILKGQGQTPSTVADSELTNIASYTTKLNSHLSALLSDTNSLATNKQNIITAQQALDKLQSGADPLDIQSSQLSVTKAQNALQDAQTALSDYTVRAPFSGTLANVNIHRGDQASSGSAIATLISGNQIADLSLNEVDAAKVKVGDKATLTFDAIDDLSIAGTVASINQLGTVSQGVVSYTIKIQFSTADDRVKPGMTVNANIIIDTHQNVLTVPSSAIKTQGANNFVQVFTPPLSDTGGTAGTVSAIAPQQVPVTVGLSDDTNTEIVSGLTEGQQIVTRTITGTAAAATTGTRTTTPGRGGFGGGIRLGG